LVRVILSELRRTVTHVALRLALRTSAWLPANARRRTIHTLTELSGTVPTVRRRVRENMCLAFGTSLPARPEIAYFRRLAWYASRAIETFHLDRRTSSILEEIEFDHSISVVVDALAKRRGAILAVPHWIGHELSAYHINRLSPMTMIVRQSQRPAQMALKLKWYANLGPEIVWSTGTSRIKNAASYLRVLKKGQLLAISPDLLAGLERGVEVQIFGRVAQLHAGAFVLADVAQAPILRMHPIWLSDSHVVISWDCAPEPPPGLTRQEAIQFAAQDWCCWFEDKLKAHPENWLFWLDKRWSRFLRTVERRPSSG
jgi:lauroyl/myristoyl acyltransferase